MQFNINGTLRSSKNALIEKIEIFDQNFYKVNP